MQENISCKIYSNVHGKMLLLFQLHSKVTTYFDTTVFVL